jgi:hypothetical protein
MYPCPLCILYPTSLSVLIVSEVIVHPVDHLRPIPRLEDDEGGMRVKDARDIRMDEKPTTPCRFRHAV